MYNTILHVMPKAPNVWDLIEVKYNCELYYILNVSIFVKREGHIIKTQVV